ncbi:MAG: succinyl-diaminopimelate desuccinylase [Paracoccaceae bacterium]
MSVDPVDLTARLVRCASVTPADAGALDLLGATLSAAGFECIRADREGTPNLLARWGPRGHPRTFGFNGHTDVVPAGDVAAWTHDPFGAVIADGRLHGRGSVDMKSAVAAFACAACDLVAHAPPDGAILITVTGDEEGPATHGTPAILSRMDALGEAMTVCLVGEPTSPDRMGEAIKIGRRGSLTARVAARGVQGHAAYPHRARNPVHALLAFLGPLAATPLDEGTEHFDPSTLQVVTVDTGNPATNVIPATATATLNIRFNDRHTGAGLSATLRDAARAVEARTGVTLTLDLHVSGEAFLTPPGPFSQLVQDAVEAETGRRPELSTSGGTSDARFVKDHCPVVECGLVGRGMHMVDESVPVADIVTLTAIYRRILGDWFARG